VLVGGAQHEHVGRHVIAEEPLGDPLRVEEEAVRRPSGALDGVEVVGKAMEGSRTMAMVATPAVLTTPTVRLGSQAARFSVPAAPSRSSPSSRSTERDPALTAPSIG